MGLLQSGDVLKLKSCSKASLITELIGFDIKEIEKYIKTDPDFDSFYRPTKEEDKNV